MPRNTSKKLSTKKPKCKSKCRNKYNNKKLSLKEYKNSMKKLYKKPMLRDLGLKYEDKQVEADYIKQYIPWCMEQCMK